MSLLVLLCYAILHIPKQIKYTHFAEILPYHHTLYATQHLTYRTHIYHHTTIYQGIPSWWHTLYSILPYHYTVYTTYIYPIEQLTLYTTLPYHHTLYITLNLPYRTSYPAYHLTIPSYFIHHPKSTL